MSESKANIVANTYSSKESTAMHGNIVLHIVPHIVKAYRIVVHIVVQRVLHIVKARQIDDRLSRNILSKASRGRIEAPSHGKNRRLHGILNIVQFIRSTDVFVVLS